MTDEPSAEDFRKLAESLKGLTQGIDRFRGQDAQGDKSRDEATRTLRGALGEHRKRAKDIDGRLRNHVISVEDGLRMFEGGLRESSRNIRQIMTKFFGGAILGAIVERGMEMSKTFGDLSEVGQNFGGSLMKMHHAAASAGLPLSDFAELVKKNSAVMATMGQKDFTALALSVRKAAERNGMYGYSVEQLNQQVGDYLETSRLYGSNFLKSSDQSTKSLIDLAEETTTMAAVTGKARSEISQLAAEAMRSSFAVAQMRSLPNDVRDSTQLALAKVTTVFAAQQGEAGRLLSQFAADTFGAGSSVFTEGGKTLIEGGMGQLASAMDDLSQKVRNGTATAQDANEYNNKFIDEVDANIEQLKLAAMAGNAQAKSIIDARSQMRKLTEQEMAEKKKEATQRSLFTKLFGDFESAWGRVVGKFNEGLYKALEPIAGQIEAFFGNDGGFQGIVDEAGKLGTWLGGLIQKLCTRQNVDNMVHIASDIGNTALALGKFATAIVGFLSSPIFTMMSLGIRVMTGFVTTVSSVAGIFGKTFGHIAGTVASAFAVFGYFMGKKFLGNLFSGMFSKKMITAAVVNVFGKKINGVGGGGGGDDGLGGGGGGEERSRRRRANRNSPHEIAVRERAARMRRNQSFLGRRWNKIKGGGKWFEGFGTDALHSAKSAGKAGLGGLLGFAKSGKGKGILALLAILGSISAFAGAADAATPGEAKVKPKDDGTRWHDVATPVKLLRASQITNSKDREAFTSLLAEQARLRKEDQDDPKVAADTKRVNEQLNGLRDKYGSMVTDLHDIRTGRTTIGPLKQGNTARPDDAQARQGGWRGALNSISDMAGVAKIPGYNDGKPVEAGDKKSGGWGGWLTAAQLGLTAASMTNIPFLQQGAGLLNAGIDGFGRGDMMGAGLDLATMIPGLGDAAGASKIARLSGKAIGAAAMSNDIFGWTSSMAGPKDPEPKITATDDTDTQTSPAVPPVITSTSPETTAIDKLTSQSQDTAKMQAAQLQRLITLQEQMIRLMGKQLNMS